MANQPSDQRAAPAIHNCVPTMRRDDTMNGEIESATAVKMSADYEEITRKHRDLLMDNHLLGVFYKGLIEEKGRDLTRHFVESHIKVPWEDVQDLVADLNNTELQSKIDWKGEQTIVTTLAAELEHKTRPKEEIEVHLRRLHIELCKQFVDVGERSFDLGRRMVDLREQMGEQTFKLALAKACPNIPWGHAEKFMNSALDSPIARVFDGET
jgi:hypothetical protein